MMNGAAPVSTLERGALVVRDRNEACSTKLPSHLGNARQIQPAMQRGEKRNSQARQHGEMQPVNVSVNYVELSGSSRDRFQQHSAGEAGIRTWPPETQRARPHWMQSAARHRVAARKQR